MYVLEYNILNIFCMIAVNLHLDTVDRFLESWFDENFKIIAEKEMSNGHATHCPGQERSVV